MIPTLNTMLNFFMNNKHRKTLKSIFTNLVFSSIQMCDQEEKSPDKPFSGKFSLRLHPEVHSKVAQTAASAHKSIDSWITDVVENSLEKQNTTSQ